MNEINLDEIISPQLRKKIEFTISTNKDYQKLQAKHKECLRQHDYIGAIRYAKIIENVQVRVVQEIVRQQAKEIENVVVLMKSMSAEDQMRLSTSLNIILFCIDQIDFHITESNEIIKKYYPDCKLEMYDKLNAEGKEIKEHMRFIGKHETTELQIVFSDIADNLTELLVNKVKAYIRKKNEKRKSHEQ